MDRLKDNVAIITGGTHGIGKAIAQAYVDEGAQVVITAPTEDQGQAAAEELGPQATYIKQDAASENDWRNLIDQTMAKFQHLDILVNNAGRAPKVVPITEEPLDDWQKVMDLNLTGVFLGMKYAMQAMKENGGGSIINMASVEGIVGAPNGDAYNASKAGVRLLTKTAALDAATHRWGIRANAVFPGVIDTGILTPDELKQFDGITPLGRVGKPKDIAPICVYLGSDESSFAAGADFVIDGGYTAQ